MSEAIEVLVTDEHIKRISNCKPIEALTELIWNALDADAKVVKVSYSHSTLDTITKIIVRDDGHGINRSSIKSTFGEIGNSHKAASQSPSGRPLHGHKGFGRYKATLLGHEVVWESSYQNNGTGISTFRITNRADNLRKFIIEDGLDPNPQTGVEVTIGNILENASGIDNDKIKNELLEIFAPYLVANPDVKVKVGNSWLAANEMILDASEESFTLTINEKNYEFITHIVRWSSSVRSRKHYCNQAGMSIADRDLRYTMGLPLTVYVKSQYFEELDSDNRTLLIEFDEEIAKIDRKVNPIVRDYSRSIIASSAAETIKELHARGLYPYSGEPTNEIERYEREVFDVCASTVYEYLPDFKGSSDQQQKLTLNLIKESLEKNPSSIKKILTEILDLTAEEQDKFADVLGHIKLKSMINVSHLVSDRIRVLDSLEFLLNDPNEAKHLKERSQLHKILENEPWIFGEEWALSVSDKSVKTVLKRHYNLLGIEEDPEIVIKNVKGISDIPDIVLSQTKAGHHAGSYHHLVVELKRPKDPVSLVNLDQIKKYARTISKDSQFDAEKTEWKFVIVNTKFSADVNAEVTQLDRDTGLILNQEGYKVWALKWSQILQPLRQSLEYLKNKIEFEGPGEDSFNYLKEKYPHLFNAEASVASK